MSAPGFGLEAQRQWPLWIMAGLAALWLILSAISSVPALAAALPAGALVEAALPLFAPLMLLMLALAYIPMAARRVDIEQAQERIAQARYAADALETQLVRIEQLLDQCASRVGDLQRSAAADGDGLVASAGAMEVAAGTMALAAGDMGKAASQLMETLPGLTDRARDAETLLKTAGQDALAHMQALDTSIDSIASRSKSLGAEAQASIETMQGLLGQIDTTSTETTKAIANRAYALDAAVTGVLDRAREAFESVGAQLVERAQESDSRLAAARQALGAFADDTSAALATRLDRLVQVSSGLSREIEQQLALSETLEQRTTATIASIEARLEEMRQAGMDALADTDSRIGRTEAALDGLGERVEARRLATEALETHVARLRPLIQDFGEAADARLPVIAEAVDTLASRSRGMVEQLDQLRTRVLEQTSLLSESAQAFDREHALVTGLADTLSEHFGTARSMLNDIHQTTEQTAIASASRMVETVMQVRQAVNGKADEIRALIAEVVDNAEAALSELAGPKAETVFIGPMRSHVTTLETAAEKAGEAAILASERVSQQLVGLLRTVAETEARIDEVDARMDIRARDTLAARSIRLVETLESASVDVARLLGVEVEKDAWARYLAGDRNLFARATVRLAGKDMARKISRLYTHDDAFQEEAARYLDQFELLLRRVLKDPDGEAFALTLLSSDIGKLYVLIAQGIGRPLPRTAD